MGSSFGSDDSVLYRTISVDYVLWVNSIFTVNINNNVMVVNDVASTIVEAFYDISLLLAEINLACNLLGAASVVTGVITWTSSAPFTLGGPACTMLTLLGGVTGVTYSSTQTGDEQYTLVMPKPVNMLSTQLLRFTCPSLPLRGFISGSQESLLIAVPNNADAFAQGTFLNNSGIGTQVLPEHTDTQVLHIQVRNEAGQLVDFNQTAWILAISITTMRLIQPEKLNINAVVGSADDVVEDAEGDDVEEEDAVPPPDTELSQLLSQVGIDGAAPADYATESDAGHVATNN